jgi:hypothetical protein
MAPHAGVSLVAENVFMAATIAPFPTLYDLVPDLGELVTYRGDLIKFGGCVVQLRRVIS